ncbi:MAG: hypothetical protein ACYC7L_14600, partial [Nitrospirota bacterium]
VASDYPFSAEFWSGNLTLPELANPMYFLAQKAVLQLLYERTDFNPVEFDGIRRQAGETKPWATSRCD